MKWFWRRFKRVLPKSLFGRAMLIVVLPTLLVQAVTTYIFYERHWENVSKHMTLALANELAFIVRQAEVPDHRLGAMRQAERFFQIQARWQPRKHPAKPHVDDDKILQVLRAHLAQRLTHPFSLEQVELNHDEKIRTIVHLRGGDVQMLASRKRISSPTTTIFMYWATGSALLFLLIALLFLYNQVKPMEQLANVAEDFGRGKEIAAFKPRGAVEVRRAGQAFLVMSERIRRQMSQRMEMLAAISHDVRTPITRMKLQLAMMEDSTDTQLLRQDVREMETMLESYLDFVRGEAGEVEQDVPIREWTEELAAQARRLGLQVELECRTNIVLHMREQALRRAIMNLMNNAARYATAVHLRVWKRGHVLAFVLDDNGPGVVDEERDKLFRPFYRGDASRSRAKGEGVGLGLSITRDIILSHGGSIELANAPTGGLRVSIRLPV